MNKGIDIQLIRDSYQRMSDDEFERIATQDSTGLTLEAQEVVKEEIERRKLDTNIAKGVQAQNKAYSVEEIDEYCNLVRKLTCPACDATFSKLNATMTSEVMSFILFTQYKKQIKVGCPDCLDKANKIALTKTAVLGWWGIPWGVIRTIQAIRQNMNYSKTNHLDTPNDFLRSFVLSKIGQIETYKDNKDKLQEIISSE